MIMPQALNSAVKPSATIAEPPTPRRMPTIWGLDARTLHAAYWRSRGVQVVECGRPITLDRDAELFMLIEPDHLVEFELSAVTESMTWNGAAVMRLRLTAPGDDHYAERIVLASPPGEPAAKEQAEGRRWWTDTPRISRVQRHYRTAGIASHRLIITRSRAHAEFWSQLGSRRQAWMRIRRSLPYYRIIHWRCSGARYDALSADEVHRYLHRLVQIWTDPHSSIEGLHEPLEQVWLQDQDELADGDLVIGPAFIGKRADSRAGLLLIGPDFAPDDHDPAPTRPARVRSIGEVEPGDRRRIEADEESPGGNGDPGDGSGNGPAPRLSPGYLAAKRAFDIFISAMVLLAASPLLLALALAVMIDDGRPIFFGHQRQSRGGRLFRCWKFRTMRRDADRLTRELQSLNQCDGPQFYIANDPRVTRVGRFMRRFHLDELPQFWNVLVGDMSIVGPRPSPDSENQFCPAWRETRLSVRPGITGLWQVERTRAPGMDFQEWIRYDTEYVRRAGFLLDCRILVKTAHRLMARR